MKTRILKEWKVISDSLGGKIKFKEDIQSNIEGYILTIKIVKEINNGAFIISQTIMVYDENDLQFTPILIEYRAECEKKINVHVWKRGFIERVFSIGIKTGNAEIDKKACIKTDLNDELLILFKKEELVDYILSNTLFFSITTKESDLIFKVKVQNIEDVLEMFKFMRFIIDDLTRRLAQMG